MLSYYSIKEKVFRIIAFLFGLVTIIAQFVIMIQENGNGDLFATIIRFFSFMTILSNILTALVYILPLAAVNSKAGKFFAKPKTQSAVLVYIVVVCLGYHFLLAKIWKPEGLQYLVDKSLHYFVPVIYLLFYLIFVKKGTLAYNNIFKWLIFPAIYLVYAIIRGLFTGNYPYPFLDLDKHEVSKVLSIVGVLFLAYTFISLSVVFYDKTVSKKAS